MKRAPLLLAVTAATLLSTAHRADAHLLRPGCNASLPAKQELACARHNLDHATATIGWARTRLADIQQQLRNPVAQTLTGTEGAVRYPASVSTISPVEAVTLAGQTKLLAQMIHNHKWVERTMRARVSEARQRLVPVIPAIGDWMTAVNYVQRFYPGSSWWLTSCSSTEGGHGAWIWNGGHPLGSPDHGSGAGGWMQYMEGTFWGDFHSAERDLIARGVHVPSFAASYTSAVGQALAAGWAYRYNRPAGKWTGSGC